MEENTKPNWKQWIPIYGIYLVGKDTLEGKPSLVDESPPARLFVSAIYHAIATSGVIASLGYSLEKLLD